MAKSSFLFLNILILAVSLWTVNCLTKEEETAVMEILEPMMMDCMKECNIKDEDIKKSSIDDIDPCFKKCMFKSVGLLNNDGKYDSAAVKQIVSEIVSNEEEANRIFNVIDDCFKGIEEKLKGAQDPDLKRIDILFKCIKKYPKA